MGAIGAVLIAAILAFSFANAGTETDDDDRDEMKSLQDLSHEKLRRLEQALEVEKSLEAADLEVLSERRMVSAALHVRGVRRQRSLQ